MNLPASTINTVPGVMLALYQQKQQTFFTTKSPLKKKNKTIPSKTTEPELGGLGLAAVGEGLLDIVGGVVLGGLGAGGRGIGRRRGVLGEGPAVLGLDGPDAALVVHGGTGELADSRHQRRVAGLGPDLRRRRHLWSGAEMGRRWG